MSKRDNQRKIRILIVDDHPMVREGIRALIYAQPDMVVCGESDGGQDLLRQVVELRPDVATLDIHLGQQNGLDLVPILRELHASLKVIVLSMHETRLYRERAVAAGAHGFVTKWSATRALFPVIRKLMLDRTATACPGETVGSQAHKINPTITCRNMKSFTSVLRTAAAITMMVGISTVQAATLTAVPMQGGMAMPMVAYRATLGRLSVMMPADIPQLTPLLVSNPGDSFDPTDPWFESLDPSRQGSSFSRRYGFVMDTTSDPLPANTAIWLRKVSGSPELSFFRYSGSAPKNWEPIFGTAGSATSLLWNGMMFHPGVTAPPGTNSLSAIIEAYLVDTNTGQEVSGSSSGPLEFGWTNVLDGRPTLECGMRFVVAWPAGTTGYELEWADTLSATNWTSVSTASVVIDGQPAVVLKPEAATRFFRMRKSP
jgi:DNA-binding NarL/FixJ family response regulator